MGRGVAVCGRLTLAPTQSAACLRLCNTAGEDPETPGGFTVASSQGGESVSNPWDDDELVFQDFDVVGEDGAIDLGMMIDMGEFEP